MANGDVVNQISDQYLQQFDRSIGVSGMQKLQNFPALQKLGYNGILSHIKGDFHGLMDFKKQMTLYSSVSSTLSIAWSLIQFIVPNNATILAKLINVPGLGSVGSAFTSIHNFGRVFSLTSGDLKSPATVSAKASVYSNQSTKANVVTDYTSQAAIGGGATPASYANASSINGLLVIGVPSAVNNTLIYNGTNLIWAPADGGTDVDTLAGDGDVRITLPSSGQVLVYDGVKWVNAPSTGSGTGGSYINGTGMLVSSVTARLTSNSMSVSSGSITAVGTAPGIASLTGLSSSISTGVIIAASTVVTLASLTAPNGSQYVDYRGNGPSTTVDKNFSTAGSLFDQSLNSKSGFVSRNSISDLVPVGRKVYVATLDWWQSGHSTFSPPANGSHIDNGTTSNDSVQQQKKIAEIAARGFSGVYPTWYGTGTDLGGHVHTGLTNINSSMLLELAQCAAQGLEFFMMLEHLAFDPSQLGSTFDPTAQIKAYMLYANTNYFGSPAYKRISGRPVFGFFGENLVAGINWNSIDSYCQANGFHPWWIFRNDAGYSKGSPNISCGNFGWPEPGDSGYVSYWYSQAASHLSFTSIAPIYKGFHDKLTCPNSSTLGNWCGGAPRDIAQSNGQTWLDTISTFAGSALPFGLVGTWDDYEEGTAIETGIRSALVITPSMSGSTVNWSVTGNENAIVKYAIYTAPTGDVTHLSLMGNVNVGSPRSFVLSGLSPGTYDIYVYAIGDCSIQNVIASTSYTL